MHDLFIRTAGIYLNLKHVVSNVLSTYNTPSRVDSTSIYGLMIPGRLRQTVLCVLARLRSMHT